MFFNKDSQKYITMERDNEDLLIKNNELKSKIKILEKLVNKSRDYITDDIFLGKLFSKSEIRSAMTLSPSP